MKFRGNVGIAVGLLADLETPRKVQSKMCALVLLALAGIKRNDGIWSTATNQWLRIHDLNVFIKSEYRVSYAENSRETIRKQALHPFRDAAFVEDNGEPTNSPNYRYRITEEFLAVLKNRSAEKIAEFLPAHESLVSRYASHRDMRKIPITVNRRKLSLTPGKHNQLQKYVVEEFASRFAPGAECLYVGDSAEKCLVMDREGLSSVGCPISVHDKLPDVVLFDRNHNWLFFVEAVTSVGPMSPARVNELKLMSQSSTAGRVFVTAFLDFNSYKKFSADLAWETEVWIAEIPDHMIHLNGDRFLGPRS